MNLPTEEIMRLVARELTRLVTTYPDEFRLGIEESNGDHAFAGDPESGRSLAYDIGRSLGRSYDIPRTFPRT